MPLLSQETVIKEYFSQVRDQYPDLDYERFEEVCRSPFLFIKECIRSGALPVILVKYLGKFRVFSSSVAKLKRITKVYFDRGFMDEVEYENKIDFLDRYAARLEKEKVKESQLNLEEDEQDN